MSAVTKSGSEGVSIEIESMGGGMFMMDVAILSDKGFPMMGGGGEVSEAFLRALQRRISELIGNRSEAT